MTPLPTETITRYVCRDKAGRVLCVTNELGAEQLGGMAEKVTIPTEAAVKAVLTGIDGVGWANREGDVLTWSVTASGGRNGHAIINAIRHATRWPASVAPSGGCVFVWPTATVNKR